MTESPGHVARRLDTAAFVLGQIRAGHTPWGTAPDPDTPKDTTMNDDVIDTAGPYRVRLELDTDAPNPRRDYDHLCNVITPTQSRYLPIDDDGGPLQYGWNYYRVRPDSEELFVRWARMRHGVTVVVDRPTEGAWALWYLMPDKAAESSAPPEQVIKAEIAEYTAWASDEVYGYIIEKSVTWKAEGEHEDEIPDEMTTWEQVDSCWGYYGRDDAEQTAREEFAPYKEA